MIDEGRCQNSHESCQNDKVWLIFVQRFDQCRIEQRPFNKFLVCNTLDTDARFAGAIQTGRSWPIAKDNTEIQW